MSDTGPYLAAWKNALSHLAEAQAMNPEDSPAAIIHSAYYAMFHAARACLIRQTGRTPKTHNHIIEQFGLLVKDIDVAERQAARDFNKTSDLRIDADYRDTVAITASDAIESLVKAKSFLSLCAARFGFDLQEAPK